MQTKKDRNKILIAVDGSDRSLDAVRYVSIVFPPQETEVVLFNVNPEIPELYRDMEQNILFSSKMPQIRGWRAEQDKFISEFMNKALEVLVDAGFPMDLVKMKAEGKKIGITRDIIKECRKNYSAVVVGRIGVSKVKDLLIGSVATKLVGKIKQIPLVIVGGVQHPKKIIIAFDGSEGARKGVAYIGSLLGASDCEVMLSHILRSLGTLKRGATRLFSPEKELEWLEENKNKIEPAIDKAKNILTKAGLTANSVQSQILTNKKSRAGSILEEAKTGGYGTIVVGRRRDISFGEEFIIGRVSHKILQLADNLAVWMVS